MCTYLTRLRKPGVFGEQREGAHLGRLYTATWRSVVGEEPGEGWGSSAQDFVY